MEQSECKIAKKFDEITPDCVGNTETTQLIVEKIKEMDRKIRDLEVLVIEVVEGMKSWMKTP